MQEKAKRYFLFFNVNLSSDIRPSRRPSLSKRSGARHQAPNGAWTEQPPSLITLIGLVAAAKE